jgi:hypothetical protein
MKRFCSILIAALALATTASASVFLGGVNDVKSTPLATRQSSCHVTDFYRKNAFESENKRQKMARMVRRHVNPTSNGAAMAIPGMLCIGSSCGCGCPVTIF